MPFLSLWLAGYATGLILADSGFPLGVGFTLGLHVAVAAAFRGRPGLWLAIGLIGVVAGLLSLGSALRSAERDRPVSIEERVVEGDIVGVDTRGGRARVTLARLRAEDGRPAPDRLEVWTDVGDSGVSLATRPPGCRIRVRLRISPIASSSNPGIPDPAKHARRRGLGARGNLVDPRLHVP
ncbi:MAG: DUF4131 domain-containing protein [bacterium]|nr:DUF4131 domain-containing protein [bacterium]